MNQSSEFSTEFGRQAAFGTPVVAATAWTMNDVLIALSIFYVLFQTWYLTKKYKKEFGQWPWQDLFRRR